ncbi:hypothetical protein ACYZT2_06265 [Pseudomonas sp. MDT1-85]
MKLVIMVVPEGEDFASYEREIPVSVEDLKPIMGWAKDDDCVYDYRLRRIAHGSDAVSYL